MRIEITQVHEETFTFTPGDGDAPVTIRSGWLRKVLLERCPHMVIDLIFPEDTLEEMTRLHGLEAPRLASMTEEEALEPVIVGIWPGGTNILIDGAHRRAYWAARGRYTLKGWAVPYDLWNAFTFDPETEPGVIAHLADGSLLPQRRAK